MNKRQSKKVQFKKFNPNVFKEQTGILKHHKKLESVLSCKINFKLPPKVPDEEFNKLNQENEQNKQIFAENFGTRNNGFQTTAIHEEKKSIPRKIVVNGVNYYKKQKGKKTSTAENNLTSTDIALIQAASKVHYTPPLSYRWVKIFGMIFLVLPFLFIYISFYHDFDPSFVLDFTDAATLPLIMLAAFILILNKDKDAKKSVLVYGVLSIAIFALVTFVFNRYVVTYYVVTNPDLSFAEARSLANDFVADIKLVNYNIFVDLFLCALFYFFTNTTPKKVRNSKSTLILFRACAVLPVLYVIGSTLLLGFKEIGTINLPVEFISLLTCRPLAVYFVFFGLSLYLAYSKHRYIKKGGSQQGLAVYTKSNAHTLQFSVVCVILFAVVSLIEFLLSLIPALSNFGIGQSFLFCTIIPILMLVNYQKHHKSTLIDLFLPIISFMVILLLIIGLVFNMIMLDV